ncbi:hypothetical protein RIF29_14540 [Crotalaria pallida]|uniref:Uncharacterized protein n=1 Tax=Crotalaria pallida TaxID=3830 RepID=A0AAN9ICU5_CROPI
MDSVTNPSTFPSPTPNINSESLPPNPHPSQAPTASDNNHPQIPNPLLSDNTFTSGTTDKDQFGDEEETTNKRCHRKSRWDPQPDSNETNGSDSGTVPKKRKSRWAEEPSPAGIQRAISICS